MRRVSYMVYFGFLIPKYAKVLPLDLNCLKNVIGFKCGLMLLHQFLDFMHSIHNKHLRFGYLDFQNIYFVRNA